MPIYDFKCPKCGHIQEGWVIRRPIEHFCNICKTKMEKLFPTKGTFILKGKGWFNSNDKK